MLGAEGLKFGRKVLKFSSVHKQLTQFTSFIIGILTTNLFWGTRGKVRLRYLSSPTFMFILNTNHRRKKEAGISNCICTFSSLRNQVTPNCCPSSDDGFNAVFVVLIRDKRYGGRDALEVLRPATVDRSVSGRRATATCHQPLMTDDKKPRGGPRSADSPPDPQTPILPLHTHASPRRGHLWESNTEHERFHPTFPDNTWFTIHHP